jgi:preprotein translocase subunit SecB
MSDEDKKANGANPDDASPESGSAPQFNILAQYIKDLSFESPNSPRSLQGPGDEPNLSLDIGVDGKKLSDDVYEIVLKFNALAKNKEGVIYSMELLYGGLFRLQDIPEQAVHPVMFIDCPTLLFPFLRRMVADLSREGGFPPIYLDPIDFAAMYRNNMQAAAKKAQQEPASST